MHENSSSQTDRDAVMFKFSDISGKIPSFSGAVWNSHIFGECVSTVQMEGERP